MSNETPRDVTAETGSSIDPARPAFMGPEAPVGGSPTPAGAAMAGAGKGRVWVPLAIAGALLVGVVLGAGGTLLLTNDDAPDAAAQPAQAAAGPTDGSGTGAAVTIPQVGSDDPDAYGTVQVSGSPLPRLEGADLAVGFDAPELRGADFDGNPVAIVNDGRAKILFFVAHWCPYCREELPVVRDWYATADIPSDVDLYSVSTLTDFTRGNYPPRTWLEQESWNVPIIVDDDSDTAAEAFGLNAVPFWVLINPDGTIAGRGAGGGVPAEALDELAAQLSATAAPPDPGQ